MAKLTWLSTDDYREGETPLDSCVWCGVLFTAGDAVEVTDPWMIAKARGNRFFRVEEPPAADDDIFGDPKPMLKRLRAELESNGNPRPETWTNDPPPPIDEPPRYPTTPPDYPPEDEPEREPNKRRGRPKRIRENGDGTE